MIAVMIKDEYPDLVIGYKYTVKRIYHPSNNYIMVEGSPRRYLSNSFEFWHDGKKISLAEAYRRQQIETVKRKLGMK